MSGARETSVRSELIRLIEADIVAGTLPLSRDNNIERKGYAEALGVSKSAMSFYKEVFQGFENLTNAPSKAEALIAVLNNVIREMMQAGELELASGRVNRTQVLARVGRSGGSLIRRHPEIKVFFAEWDKKVKDEGYRPLSVVTKVAELEELLCLPQYQNPTTGYAIRSALFRAMHGVEGNFGEPYKSILDEFDSARTETLEQDALSIRVDGTWFHFHEFVQAGYPEDAIVRVAHAFELAADTGDHKSQYAKFKALRMLLLWLAASKSPQGRQLFDFVRGVVRSLAKGTYDQFVVEYSDFLVRTIGPGVLNNAIVHTNSACDLLSRIGVLPPTSSRFRKRKVATSPNRTVAEVFISQRALSDEEPSTEKLQQATKAMQFARSMFDEVGEADLTGEIGKQDTDAFLRTLADELSSLPQSVTGNPVKAILYVLNSRFRLMGDHFRAQCVRWTEHLRRGKALITAAVDPRSYLASKGEKFELTRENIAALKSHFLNHTGSTDSVMGDVLRAVKELFQGVYPNQFHPIQEVRSFFAGLCEKLGSRLVIQAYLTPHKDLIGSAIALYLLESGSNLAVARSLFEDAVEYTDEIGYKKVTGLKARAAGKPIVAFLEMNSDALQSIETIREALAGYRHLPSENDANMLFLLTKGSHLQAVKADWFREWFKGQIKTINGLSALELTPNMLRPSVLLQAALEQNGRFRKAIMLAQHGESVAGSYYFRFPVRFLHDAEIRSYMTAAETITVHRLPDGAAYLNISQEEFDVRVAAVKNIGLGTGCKNPDAKPGQEGAACDSPDCFDCPNVFLIAEPENIAALQLWRGSLLQVEGDWIRDHPDRWELKYLPWLTFIEVVEEEMQQPNLIDIWDQASILANEISNHQGYRPYRPIS